MIDVTPQIIESASKILEAEVFPRVLERAKGQCPVRTGALRDSLDWQKSGEAEWQFASHTDNGYGNGYGGYVEFGTSRMQAQPYLGPSFSE